MRIMLVRKLSKITFLPFVLILFGYILGYKTGNQFRTNIYFKLRDRFIPKQLIDYKKYEEEVCPLEPFHIAYFGSGNSTNTVQPFAPLKKIPDNLFQFDWKTNKCFKFKEPLLGVNGNGGNTIKYLAYELARNTNKPVLISLFGKESTSVLDWAYGYLSYQHEFMLEGLRRKNLSPQMFIWNQGEADSRELGIDPSFLKKNFRILNKNIKRMGLNQKEYKDALQVVLDRTKYYFPESYFGITLATRCKSNEWLPVRKAKIDTITINKKTLIIADGDKIYNKKYRYDNCHYSDLGAMKLSNEFLNSIKNIEEFLF